MVTVPQLREVHPFLILLISCSFFSFSSLISSILISSTFSSAFSTVWGGRTVTVSVTTLLLATSSFAIQFSLVSMLVEHDAFGIKEFGILSLVLSLRDRFVPVFFKPPLGIHNCSPGVVTPIRSSNAFRQMLWLVKYSLKLTVGNSIFAFGGGLKRKNWSSAGLLSSGLFSGMQSVVLL